MLLIFLTALLTASPSAHATDWGSILDAQGGAAVRFGVKLLGDQPFERNSGELFAPASTSKLFTAGAALELLGPDYRYPTVMRWTQNEAGIAQGLVLEGNGDPSWGMPEFKESLRSRFDGFAAALKAAGVTTVAGEPSVTAGDSRWSQITIPVGWKESDTVSCGGALGQAFNLALNCATLKITSPTKANWQSAGLNFPVVLKIQAGKSTSLSAKLGRRGLRAAPYFIIEGTWKAGPATLTLPIYDTLPWARALFREAIQAQGIKITPAREFTSGASRETTINSRPLSELIIPFLKNSVNFMGDVFLKTLGSRSARTDESLLAPGLLALQRFARENGATGFTLNDGSGLSRTSRVTPSAMLEFLDRLRQSRNFPKLWAALPIAGVDGTLTNRMKKSSAQNVLRAKTGTLDGVYNLAGYVPNGNSFVPFVILTATTGAHSAVARAAEDRMGIKLAELHLDPIASHEPIAPFPYFPEHAGFDAQ